MYRGIPVSSARFAKLRKSLTLTQAELGPKLGMSGGNVARIERTGQTGIKLRSFRLLAGLAGVSIEALKKRIGARSGTANEKAGAKAAAVEKIGRDVRGAGGVSVAAALPGRGVALLGEVTAGGLIESFVYQNEITQHLPLAFPQAERVYALRIRGDSMAPAYQPGEILIVQDLTPDQLIDGEDAVIQRDGSGDDASTFKRIVFLGGGRLKLVPLNPAYRPIECPLDSVVRIGRVLGKFTPAVPMTSASD
jgi:SOS-response transcriptional repressor LexA